jgi:hypothetical protein
MTLAEAGEIFRYWEDNPPSHLLLQAIARLLGWQPPASSIASPQMTPETALADLAAMPPPGLAVMPAIQIAMPPPILDPAALRARNDAQARAGRK